MTTTTKVARRRVRKQEAQANGQAPETTTATAHEATATPATPETTTPASEQHKAALAAANTGTELPGFWPQKPGTFRFWAATMADNGESVAYCIASEENGWRFTK